MTVLRNTVAGIALSVGLAMSAAPIMAKTPDNQLVVAMSMANILTLDPAGITGRETVQVLNSVYDTLVALDPDDPAGFVPRIAESWDIAPDNKSITFHLRKGVKFASGNPLTAEDVVWSLKRLMQVNLAQSSFLKTRGFTAANADQSFLKVDDHTFQINLPKPDDPKIVMMTLSMSGPGSIIDKALALKNEKDGDLGAAWLRTNSAGSSAYVLKQWRSNELVLLDRNDAYWGPAPAMRRVLIRHLPESQSQRLQLERGDIDVGYSLLAADLQALAKDPDVAISTEPGAGFYYLAASMKDDILSNPKVRMALRYLIDYKGINEAIMPYYGVLHQQPINSRFLGALPDPGYTLDVERAKSLLAEAGYPNGFKVTLRALADPPFLNIATAMQATLAQAGIQAEVITGSGDQIYGAMRDRNFQLVVGRGGGGQIPHPDSNLRAIAYNPNNSDDAKLTNFQGWRASFYDEKLNHMIESALVERDPAAQKTAYGAIQTYYNQIVPAIQPFSEVVDTAAYRKTVHGLVAMPWVSRFETVTKSK